MTTDLFGDLGAGPRPAWQVIESARRQLLTGELVLDTSPPTHVYLRDGEVYFAERSTDGGLGVRLLVEGVITRAQLQKGSLLVSGTEHLGRLFERDQTIEREPIELCVELMTEELLVAVAQEPVEQPQFHMFKRHTSGIDRWLPRQVEIVRTTERVVEVAPAATEPDGVAAPAHAAPTPAPDLVDVAQVEVAQVEVAQVEVVEVVEQVVPAEQPVEQLVEQPPAAEVAAPAEPIVEPVAEPVELARPRVPMSFDPPTRELPIITPATVAPTSTTPFAPPRPTDATLQLPIISDLDVPELDVPAAHPAAVEVETRAESAPAPASPPVVEPAVAQAAEPSLDELVAASVADEVAEAVRRAFAAIDLSPS